jgi:Amt family ammonium transporter
MWRRFKENAMKKLMGTIALVASLAFAGAALAQDKPAAAPEKPAPSAELAKPAAAPAVAEAARPKVEKGDVTWMMIATALVLLMMPGLALFYGGMVRSKNALSVMMQVLVTFCLIGVVWVIYGYSLTFTGGNAFFGGFSKAFLAGVTGDSLAATFSKGVAIPELVFAVFQLTFAGLTCALVVGSFAERMKFSASLLFAILWFTFAYAPIAHMVWYWDGPDAITDAKSLDAVTAAAGWLWQKGALDFAGGTVVHINAGVAGLVGAYVLGKRIGYGREAMPPHNLPLCMLGAALLWFGWFGFNAGSNLEAAPTAVVAFMNTMVATAAAILGWLLVERLGKGKPSALGAASGAVAGLVAITPACGFVGVGGALVIGAVAGVIGFWGVNGLKRLLGADDSLDVFGVHGVCGIVGALLTGVFAAPSLGGSGIYDYVANKVSPDYSIWGQVLTQGAAVLTTILWSGIVAFAVFKILDLAIGLRVTEEDEREGLDTTAHGEAAYRM